MTRWARFVASSRILDVVAIALTLAIAATAIAGNGPFDPTPLALTAVVLACLAIPFRLRFPEPVLAVAVVALLVAAQPAPVMVASGSVATVFGSRPRTWITIGIASVPVILGLAVDRYGPVGLSLIWGGVMALPTTVGLYLNSRQLAVEAAQARAEELAAAQETLAEAARRAERSRIAREMHDVVAHQVSLIALHAGGLELATEGTPAAASARMIGETAHQALEELRHVVGVLRTGDAAAERAPQVTLASVGDLVEQWREAGLDVSLVDRTPPALLATLPVQVGRTAYRIVEEGLTNVSKHAAGSRAVVDLGVVEDRLSVEVRNTAPTRISSRAQSGSGTGLYGLRERVDMVGGRFEAGPVDGDGFRVAALLPMHGGER